jgi:hypothetical protein
MPPASLSLVPVEILEGISASLAVYDVFSLIRVSRLLYTRLLRRLYYLSQHHRTCRSSVLTDRLQDVSFWYDKRGNGSVMEWAIVHGRISTFQRLLLVPKIDLLQADSYGVTLLHRVSAQGLLEYIEPLVRTLHYAGIEPFAVDDSLLTPLHYAAGRNMAEAVRVLIICGADVLARDHHGNTPLHLAAVTGSHQVFAHLVQAGADVNSEARFGWTPIDQASISHHSVAADELKRLGSRPPTWQQRQNALNEFLQLSPCPLSCYAYHIRFS